MFTRILVPLDGSQLAEGVLPLAKQLSIAYAAPIVFVSVIDAMEHLTLEHGPLERYGEAVVGTARSVAVKYLASMRERQALKSFKTSDVIQVGKAPEVIIEEAERTPGTVIVMSTHGRSGLGRFVLGSVADRVLHTTKTPLIMCHVKADQPTRTIRSVIVPLDGSELAEQALPEAVDMAKALRCGVTLVRVVALPPPTQDWTTGEVEYIPVEVLRDIEKDVQAYLTAKAAELQQQGVGQVNTKVLTGVPAATIADYVDSMPDSLVVMSSHGRSGIGRYVLGSVAGRVIGGVTSPVLVLRPELKVGRKDSAKK